MKRIKKHDLTAWFLQDHRTLPASYVKSCQKFFEAGREDAEMYKRQAIDETVPYNDIEEAQASSDEPQATSVKRCNLFTTMLDKKTESEK